MPNPIPTPGTPTPWASPAPAAPKTADDLYRNALASLPGGASTGGAAPQTTTNRSIASTRSDFNPDEGIVSGEAPIDPQFVALANQYGVSPEQLEYLANLNGGDVSAALDILKPGWNRVASGGSDPALLALQREQLEWQKRSDTLNAYIDELHEKVYSEQITREEALKQLELQIDANTAAQTARREASQWAVDPNAKFFPGFEPQGVVGQVFQKSSGMPFPGLSTTPIKTSPSAITNPLANIKNTPIDTNALAEQAWADVKAKAGI